MSLNKADKVKYLKDLYYRTLLMTTDNKPVIVDGVEYIVRDDRLVVVNLHELNKDYSFVLDNAFDEIDIPMLDEKFRTSVYDLDLSSVTKLQNNSFKECTNLKKVKGNKLKSLPSGCFKGCTKLVSAEFSNLRVVGEEVFLGTHLKDLYAPRLYVFDSRAFSGTDIESLKFEREPKFYGTTISNMTKLKKMELPCVSYVDTQFMYSNIVDLTLGKVKDNKYYYYNHYYYHDNSVIYYYFQEVYNVTDKKFIHRYVNACNKLASRHRKLRSGEFYTHTFVERLPYSLKDLYIDLSELDTELQNFYKFMFKILQQRGVNVHYIQS